MSFETIEGRLPRSGPTEDFSLSYSISGNIRLNLLDSGFKLAGVYTYAGAAVSLVPIASVECLVSGGYEDSILGSITPV